MIPGKVQTRGWSRFVSVDSPRLTMVQLDHGAKVIHVQ